MLDFNFRNPTEIVFGKDKIDTLNQLVPQDARVLILYGGGSVKKFGTLDKVKDALKGREIIEFSGIEPNPRFTTLIKAVDIIKKENINFLLALGGGSVMDGTKFINLAVNYDGDNLEDLFIRGNAQKQTFTKIPFGNVVTLPATGSEMNVNMVISHKEAKYGLSNQNLYPDFSILDPSLTYTLPATQVANGIVDTFIHVVEQYVTYPVEGRLQDRMAEGILQTLVEIGKYTIDNPEDYDARANLMWCATMALNGLLSKGVPGDWSTHQIGHQLTALYGIDHAKTLAILQPSLWTLRKAEKGEKLLQYGERVWNITEGTVEERIDATIEKTREFFEGLGIKTHLSDYGVNEDQVEVIMAALKKNSIYNISESGKLGLDTIGRAIKLSL